MNRSVFLAVLIVIGAVAWVLTGQFDTGLLPTAGKADAATEAPATEAPAADPAKAEAAKVVEKVRVVRLAAQPMINEVILNGRTEASRSVELRAEVRGRVDEVLVERGARVSQGQVILRLAVNDRRVMVDQAKALLAQRKIELDAAEALYRRGNGTEISLAAARTQYDLAQATLRTAEIALANTEIRAPFNGVLEARPAEIGDYLDTGNPVATIVDLQPVRVVGYATERAVQDLRVGAVGHALVVGGTPVEGRISYVAATADAATRTFRVEMEVPNTDGRLISGLTAQIRLPLGERPAHFVSPSVLSLDDNGTVGIKYVDDEDKVRFQAVQILGTSAEGAWLGGLPKELRLITVGHEFVKAGNKVLPVEMNGGAS